MITDAYKLPACIFCGGRTRFLSDHSGHNHFLVRCVDDNHCSGEGPIRPTRAEAVAAFLKPVADARRKAAGECRAVMNTIGQRMKDANPGPQITAAHKIDGILMAEEAIRALMDAPDPAAPEDAA